MMVSDWQSDEQERRGTVLVVDDEPQVLALLNELLDFEGYEVETANDGLEALLCLRQKEEPRPVDVVVTDVMMPRMDGLTLAQRIEQEVGKVPIILLSAGLDVARDAPWPFLGKPFDLDELLGLIEDAIGASDPPPVPTDLDATRSQAAD